METFSFMPKAEDAERLRERVKATRPWWIEFDPPVTHLFCDRSHLAAAHEADYGIAWTGVSTHHHPRQVPTDRQDVWLLEYGAPIERMAVDEPWMPSWMEVVRANHIHGRYKEAGVGPWYEF